MLGNFTGDSGSGGSCGLVPAPPVGSSASGFVLGAGGAWIASGSFNLAGNYATTGVWSFANSSFTLSGLASATTANVVYYGVGGILTKGALPNSFLVGGNSAVGATFIGLTSAQILNIGANSQNSIIINAASLDLGGSVSTTVTLGASATTLNLGAVGAATVQNASTFSLTAATTVAINAPTSATITSPLAILNVGAGVVRLTTSAAKVAPTGFFNLMFDNATGNIVISSTANP